MFPSKVLSWAWSSSQLNLLAQSVFFTQVGFSTEGKSAGNTDVSSVLGLTVVVAVDDSDCFFIPSSESSDGGEKV